MAKILAIDPGSEQSAYVMWDTERHDFVIDGGIGDEAGLPIDEKAILPNEEMHNVVSRAIINIGIELIAIEMIQSYGHAVGRSTFQTILFIGSIMQAAGYEMAVVPTVIPVRLYARTTIKGALGGCKTDADVRQAIRQRYGEARKGEKLEGVVKDIWSALALAIVLDENSKLKTW